MRAEQRRIAVARQRELEDQELEALRAQNKAREAEAA